MSAVARGRWNLDEALVTLWERSTLNAAFRAHWTSAAFSEYPVLHMDEARPQPPGPYCVVEIMTPVILGHMSGLTSSTERQLQRVAARFHIHAANQDEAVGPRTGKDIACELAKLVMAVYDPPVVLPINVDSHVSTLRGADWCVREGDEDWKWVIEYEFVIDAAYNSV